MGCGRAGGFGVGGIVNLARIVAEFPGEVEFDWNAILHRDLYEDADRDEEQVWRKLRVLERRSDSHMAAAAAGWDRPVSTEAFILGALFESPWIGGTRHSLLPVRKSPVSDAAKLVARMSLRAEREQPSAGGSSERADEEQHDAGDRPEQG